MNSWVSKLFAPKQKSSASKKKKNRVNTTPQNRQFLAVTVYSRDECCEAAKRLAGQKFLADHAPGLPLGGCTQPNQCRCRYRHMADRREELRRDADFGLPGRTAGPQGERRNRRDRRSNRGSAQP